MTVPKSYINLAASRGTNAEGAVPANTMIIFAIGGIKYSTDYNPWSWLTSKEGNAVARSIFSMFFQISPFYFAFCHFVMIFQRENLGAFVVSHYISNQNQLFYFKNQNKAGKKQNKLEIFEKTAGKCFKQ